jgi:hypothetical protein
MKAFYLHNLGFGIEMTRNFSINEMKALCHIRTGCIHGTITPKPKTQQRHLCGMVILEHYPYVELFRGFDSRCNAWENFNDADVSSWLIQSFNIV